MAPGDDGCVVGLLLDRVRDLSPQVAVLPVLLDPSPDQEARGSSQQEEQELVHATPGAGPLEWA